MKTRKPLNLTKLGVIYGALWGMAAVLILLCIDGFSLRKLPRILLSVPVFALLGVPVGIAVTRCFAPLLHRASWGGLLRIAPLTLLVGSFLYGLANTAAVWTRALLVGGKVDWFFAKAWAVPLVYSFYAFLFVWPIGLAVLNCWHLRAQLVRRAADTGTVWNIEIAPRT